MPNTTEMTKSVKIDFKYKESLEEMIRAMDEATKEASEASGMTQRVKTQAKLTQKMFNDFQSLKTSLITSFLDGLKTIFTEGLDELTHIVDSSRLSNQATREQMFQYGFSFAQSYGFSQAKSLMGINSEEDLVYMDDTERKKFLQLFNKYTEKYNELYDKGFYDDLRELEIEKEEFFQDVRLEIVTFFINNKDLIREGMNGLLEIMKVVTKILAVVTGLFAQDHSDEAREAIVSEVINNRSSNSRVINANMYNSLNGITQPQDVESLMARSFTQWKKVLEEE